MSQTRYTEDIGSAAGVQISQLIDQIKQLRQIGAALSGEKNIDRLLEMIVEKAREFTGADGGTLYIMSDDDSALDFAIIQSSSLNIHMGGTGEPISWNPVMMKNQQGEPNHANVSSHVAIMGKVVNIADAYAVEGFDFAGTRAFDLENGYHSKSMLVVPLKNHEEDIIGVLQLINALDPITGKIIPFSPECEQMTESLASQAAIAVSYNRLIHELEDLLESFIGSIATAIDEKSRYTGGHIRRVAELTVLIAEEINATRDGPFAQIFFDPTRMKELKTAAWLHDVGKITTPEYVVDKSKKLETIFDRIEILHMRFEIIKLSHEIEKLKKKVKKAETSSVSPHKPPLGGDEARGPDRDCDTFNAKMDENFNFLVAINSGNLPINNEAVSRIQDIAKVHWSLDGRSRSLLTDEEIQYLTVFEGTLTSKERDIINNHAMVTYKMLSTLPFPKKMKNVPYFAATHHEKTNGSGYPFGLREEEIPLQSRILLMADIFEALTAKDRPYKKAMTLSEALRIMDVMVEEEHIDRDLFDLFKKKKIYLPYAKKELMARQIDVCD